jgi:hypothetical protein
LLPEQPGRTKARMRKKISTACFMNSPFQDP